MRVKLLLLCLFSFSVSLSAQRRVQVDTLIYKGQIMGYTTTNWYCIEGDKCPSFAVKNDKGHMITNKDIKGKVVVISFWISTCGPCLKELSRVGPEIIDQYSLEDFLFLAIGSGETAESAKRFRQLSEATFPLCYDPTGAVFKKFADNGFPKLFVVDADGIVRMVAEGYNAQKFNALKQMVAKLISKKKKKAQNAVL